MVRDGRSLWSLLYVFPKFLRLNFFGKYESERGRFAAFGD